MTTRKTKRVKKGKRKFDLLHFSFNMTVLVGILFLASSLFFRSYNNGLSTQIQELNNEITTLETANDAIQVDIQTLANRDRVNTIASSDGMKADSDSVITISQADSSGD